MIVCPNDKEGVVMVILVVNFTISVTEYNRVLIKPFIGNLKNKKLRSRHGGT